MSIEASITVMPPQELRKWKKDPKNYVFPKRIKQFEFELYHFWGDFDDALVHLGEPLQFAIMGMNRAEWDEPDEEMDTVWDAYIPPAMVKKIERALSKISDEAFLAALNQSGTKLRKRQYREFLEVFSTLKAAYRAAAKKKSYVCVLIC